MRSQRLELPCVIGGEEVRTGNLRQAVEPHAKDSVLADVHQAGPAEGGGAVPAPPRGAAEPPAKDSVLADVHQAGPAEVERAIVAAREAWHDWSRMPWEDRVAIFLRAAELLSGPWRDTLNA